MLQMSVEATRLDCAHMLRDQTSMRQWEGEARNKRVHAKFIRPYKFLKLRKLLSKDVVIMRRGGTPK